MFGYWPPMVWILFAILAAFSVVWLIALLARERKAVPAA
jgi:hypothetical protein